MTEINSSVSQKYNVLSRFYDFIWRHYTKKTIGKAITMAGLKGREVLCDIGCGTGALEKSLLQVHPGLTVAACDVSVGMIARALKKLEGFSQITFYTGDLLQIPLEKGSFDCVFSLSNLHYFRDPEPIFRRAAELAKPGGVFILVDWRQNTLRGKLYQTFMRIVDRGFRKIYLPEEATLLFQKTGWRVERCETFSVRGFWTMMCLRARKI